MPWSSLVHSSSLVELFLFHTNTRGSSFLYINLVLVRSYRLLHILHLNLGYCYSSRRGSLLPYFRIFRRITAYHISARAEPVQIIGSSSSLKCIRLSINTSDLLGAPNYLHAKPAYLLMGL